ncbi:MAG TPA: hypothetical protein VK832_14120, partial [Burkholderiaceae bacterium]|nr:hypothetical protein [Burkholderiaceae bacterium]
CVCDARRTFVRLRFSTQTESKEEDNKAKLNFEKLYQMAAVYGYNAIHSSTDFQISIFAKG